MQRREHDFRVGTKLAARADLHHLGPFLQGKQADAPQEALQVLDIVLRGLPTTRYGPVGHSFYSPNLGKRQTLDEKGTMKSVVDSTHPMVVSTSRKPTETKSTA